jgi:hypothetical protein
MAVETSKSKPRNERRSLLRRAGPAIPYTIGGLLLVGYFVWMTIEMSSDAPGGGAVPLSIFGAVLLAILAGGASILMSRRDK